MILQLRFQFDGMEILELLVKCREDFNNAMTICVEYEWEFRCKINSEKIC